MSWQQQELTGFAKQQAICSVAKEVARKKIAERTFSCWSDHQREKDRNTDDMKADVHFAQTALKQLSTSMKNKYRKRARIKTLEREHKKMSRNITEMKANLAKLHHQKITEERYLDCCRIKLK
jgi:hypothetical protein